VRVGTARLGTPTKKTNEKAAQKAAISDEKRTPTPRVGE
jgi:hypothetical protein